ncbi:MAG: AsmA family protein [Alphaproteobacteria bacterium]|nr:AsmA family protein [Alphaproteobacteria bacterium]
MLRKLIFVVLGLGGALLLVALMVPMIVNSEKLRKPMTEQLELMTGYRIVVDGPVSVRALPSARLHAEKISVFSTVQARPTPFLTMEALDVGVGFLPLLQGVVDMETIALKKPVFNLEKSNKSNNWGSKYERYYPSEGKRKPPEASKSRVLFGNVSIEGGNVTYKDMENGTTITVADIDFAANKKGAGSETYLQSTAKLNGKPVKLKAMLGALEPLDQGKQIPFEFSFASEPLTASGKGMTDRVSFSGKGEVQSPSLVEAGNWLTGKQAAGKAFPLALALKGEFSCSPSRCGVSNAAIKANETEFTGSAVYEFSTLKPMVTAELSTHLLDLNPYLPKKQASLSLIRSAHAAEGRWSDAPFDLAALNNVDSRITLNADRLVVNNFVAEQVLLRSRFELGRLLSEISSGLFYKGKGKATISADVNGNLQGQVALENVQMQPLLQAVSGNDRFEGQLSTRTEFKSSGRSERALVNNLSGNGQLKIMEGAIKGVDLAGMAGNVKSAFANAEALKGKTEFSELGGSFNIVKGIVGNDDLLIKSELVTIAGSGTVDLPNYRLNYRLTPKFGHESADPAKEKLTVPLIITGPLDRPTYTPDLSGVIKKAIQDPKKMQKQLKENLGGVKDLLKEGKGLLKGL